MRICFIQSNWHKHIVDQFRTAFDRYMDQFGPNNLTVDYLDVPGAVEMPLQAKLEAKSGKYDAIVLCALVSDGGVYRHEFVAQAVIDGVMQVQLDTEVPIIYGVLTPTNTFGDAENAFFYKHFAIKGEEAAKAALRIIEITQARAMDAIPTRQDIPAVV